VIIFIICTTEWVMLIVGRTTDG